MYIHDIANRDVIKCNGMLYNYLRDKLPLLSQDDKYYYFSRTENAEKILNDAPLHIKILLKVVGV